MNEIILYLKNIQDNLIGIILPVLITAFVSLATVLINAFIQIILQNSKFNNEQYKVMQEFYPKLKICLLELRLSMQEVKESPVCLDLMDAIHKYIEIRDNEVEYRNNHDNEIQFIDSFITIMNDFSIKVINMNNQILSSTIPRAPIMHPILKKKIGKMLVVLQYYSLLWDKYYTNKISVSIFKKELNDFEKNWNIIFDCKEIDKYLSLLSRWFVKY